MNTRYLQTTLALVLSAYGCAADAAESDDRTGPSAAGATKPADEPSAEAATSVFDEAAGEPRATNFSALDTPSRVVDPETGYPPGMSDHDKSLSGFVDKWSGAGEELGINLPADYLFLGVGARVVDSAFKTLLVKAAQSTASGGIGEAIDFYVGAQPGPLEAYCEAEWKQYNGVWYPGVIVGVGGRVDNDNLTSLTIWYRSYNPDPSVRAMFGERFQKNCGSAPGVIERFLVTPQHLPANWDYNKTVVNGISLREFDNNLAGLRLRFRQVL